MLPIPEARATEPRMLDIADWLKALGMSEYAALFAENRIDFSVLRDLTDQDLKDDLWCPRSGVLFPRHARLELDDARPPRSS